MLYAHRRHESERVMQARTSITEVSQFRCSFLFGSTRLISCCGKLMGNQLPRWCAAELGSRPTNQFPMPPRSL